ncbi:hypothetical protein AXX16_3964 [Serratia rubidaea]|nr:hypothetical protein AXX16_3964 [Serratia rubidaea]
MRSLHVGYACWLVSAALSCAAYCPLVYRIFHPASGHRRFSPRWSPPRQVFTMPLLQCRYSRRQQGAGSRQPRAGRSLRCRLPAA